MIKGESVIVERRGAFTVDAMGDKVYSTTEETVNNVLVQVGTTNDLTGGTRPDGVTVRYTLHFPKTYNSNLTGCRIRVRGEWHNVIGSPAYYAKENTPTQWNYPVEVTRTDG